jgi:hypothetical protein
LQHVDSADGKFVANVIGFVRGMAAFTLMSDLAGGDEPFPRQGCTTFFKAMFAMEPAVVSDVARAMMNPPVQDDALARTVRVAWQHFAERPRDTAHGGSITEDTLRLIGDSPEVTLVYRDPGLPGDGVGEIDVLRIGGAKHTYVVISPNAQRPLQFGRDPVCIVGDVRCAPYYVWP